MFKLKPQQPIPDITMREFFERVVDERDRQYDQRFRASEIAVSAALASAEKAVAAAFLASEKAIIKAEEAQKAYNVVHNDLSRKMDEQYKEMMPRPETLGLFKAFDEKLYAMQSNYENRLEAQRLSFEKSIDSLLKEIGGLRESRSEISGKSSGAHNLWGYLVAVAGIILALVFHFIK